MKPLKDIRVNFDFHPQENSSSIRYFSKQNIDWDVFLPSIGKNLQRGFVWTLDQKRELITSILIGRHIPHCAMINVVDHDKDHKEIFQIIDGKQRLSTLMDFYQDKFTYESDGVEYLFSELPKDYQLRISCYYFRSYLVVEPFDAPMTDEQKIKWFTFINFAGTPQEQEHLNSLK